MALADFVWLLVGAVLGVGISFAVSAFWALPRPKNPAVMQKGAAQRPAPETAGPPGG